MQMKFTAKNGLKIKTDQTIQKTNFASPLQLFLQLKLTQPEKKGQRSHKTI